MPSRFVGGLLAMLVASSMTTSVLAQNKCDAGKLKCVRNKLACLIKVHEQAQKKGLPPDPTRLQKCMDKFDGGSEPSKGCFEKLEARQDTAKPETMCSQTGDTAAVETDVDDYVAALQSLLDLTIPVTTTTLPEAPVCCQITSAPDFCTVTDPATCMALPINGLPQPAGEKCGADGCVSGTPAPGNCCDGPAGTSAPCYEPLSVLACAAFSGTLVPNAVCEATGCRPCKASNVECSTGSECCSKVCLAATLPKKCF